MKPKIFISCAREDKPLVLRLEAELAAAGAKVWVDHEGIRGGDNLPKRNSDALEWCNTMLLVWSRAARISDWVELEWTNAISLNKTIVACRLDEARFPEILANKAYLDFSDTELGIADLLQALKLARKSESPVAADSVKRVAQVIHDQLTISKKAKRNRILALAAALFATGLISVYIVAALHDQTQNRSFSLRKTPTTLSAPQVKVMLQKYRFYCREYDWSKEWSNPQGVGIENKLEVHQDGKIVIDHATGLMWQQSGSPNYLNYADAKNYLHHLNEQRFAGHNNWRLPTLEEAMSLMEPEEYDSFFIDPVFDRNQRWIWTADKESAGVPWVVSFNHGDCDYRNVDIFYDGRVRAVR